MPRGRVRPNAKKFTDRRGQLGLSQMKLFEITNGVSLKKISDIENGKWTTRATLEKFVGPLQLSSVEELILPEEVGPPVPEGGGAVPSHFVGTIPPLQIALRGREDDLDRLKGRLCRES